MPVKEQKSLSERIESVRQRLQRRRRKHKGRIPEQLWARAVELAREAGVSPIARALRLDYYSLKRRLEASRPDEESSRGEEKAAFVEIELPAAGASAQSIVRMEDRSGCCLTVQVAPGCAGELAGVARALWSCRR